MFDVEKKEQKLQLFYTCINIGVSSSAKTLNPEIVGQNDSGWCVEANIHEDYCTWINNFKATHPKYGVVIGDFENTVSAHSQEGFDHFCENHPYEDWDYEDI